MRLVAANFEGLGKEILARGYHLRFQAQGSSMLPFIRSGQVIQVAPVEVADLRLGDVILYRLPGGALVAHRLLWEQAVNGRILLITKGDSLPASKMELVEREQLLGRVVSMEFGKGRKLRIDAGWGRFFGIWLATISPAIRWIYPLLSRLKGGVPAYWGSSWTEQALSWPALAPPEAHELEISPMVSMGLPGDDPRQV